MRDSATADDNPPGTSSEASASGHDRMVLPSTSESKAVQTDVDNPLVAMGKITPDLASILVVPPEPLKIRTSGRKKAVEGRHITSDGFTDKKRKEMQDKIDRETEKQRRKEEREKAAEEKKAKAKERKKAADEKRAKAKERKDTQSRKKQSREKVESVREVRKREIRETAKRSREAMLVASRDILAEDTDITDMTAQDDDLPSFLDSCQSCHKAEPPTQNKKAKKNSWITCDLCDKWYHRCCTSMADTDLVFLCPVCLAK